LDNGIVGEARKEKDRSDNENANEREKWFENLTNARKLTKSHDDARGLC